MKMKLRMLIRMAAVLILLAAFGWRWWSAQHAHAAAGPAVAASTALEQEPAAIATTQTPASVSPTPPETLTIGELTLFECQLGRKHSAVTVPAFCTDFAVPENRADPDSRIIELRVALIRSESQVPARDLVVYLAGGPGQSAINTWPMVRGAFVPLLKHHDVLLVDQRGTGGSNALLCPDTTEKLDKLDTLKQDLAKLTTLLGQCAAEVQAFADPRYYTTTAAVADLEAVRQALGAPRFNLIGISYGTRVAQHYAAAHPEAVRSIVLDGVVPNSMILGEDFAWALQRSLKLQAKACRQTPACNEAFGNWYATLHRLYDKLKTRPPQAVSFRAPRSFEPLTRNMSAERLAALARFFSYSATTQALLPLAIDQAAKGNYQPLMAQSYMMLNGVSQSMQGGMMWSVVCTEDVPLLRPDPEAAGLLLGQQARELKAGCKGWPHGPVPQGFHAPFQSAIPTLLISGQRDPVTPPEYAAEVLEGLSNARSLVVEGLGHAEALHTGCMPVLVQHFVSQLEPGDLDAECLNRLGPTPAFVTFNGAAP